jgi:hypothetical protein
MVPLVVGDFLQRLMRHLVGAVVDQDTDPAELVYRAVDVRLQWSGSPMSLPVMTVAFPGKSSRSAVTVLAVVGSSPHRLGATRQALLGLVPCRSPSFARLADRYPASVGQTMRCDLSGI